MIRINVLGIGLAAVRRDPGPRRPERIGRRRVLEPRCSRCRQCDGRAPAQSCRRAGQWMTYGGTYSEQRFSSLEQIDASNVGTLGLRWFADYETNQNQHGSPLYIDGVIYVSTARNVVYAFDGKSGEQLWKYNPLIHGERLRYNVGLVNRGIAAWRGKIIMGTLDARFGGD